MSTTTQAIAVQATTAADRPLTTVQELDALPIGTVVMSVATGPNGVPNVVAVRVSVEHWRTTGMTYGIETQWVLGSGPVTVLVRGTFPVPAPARPADPRLM